MTKEKELAEDAGEPAELLHDDHDREEEELGPKEGCATVASFLHFTDQVNPGIE